MRFCFVITGVNCADKALASMQSVADQVGYPIRAHVVDDASTDGTAEIVEAFCEGRDGWTYTLNTVQVGAMRNQWDAWHTMAENPDDVIVWCDLDDMLAHDEVCAVLARHYASGATMTYGSYRSEPHSPTCAPSAPYPREVVRDRSFRSFIRFGGGIHHNHLRSCSWPILSQITEADCKDSRGEWWQAAPDFAVMLPAMEWAGESCHFIDEVLYSYSSDLDSAEWRLRPSSVRDAHQEIIRRPSKVRLTPYARRTAQELATGRRTQPRTAARARR